ncbi:uncharacterized protein MELLADRAFT_113541 [Melampsora larici-populina 98AG31]|uniref:Uncharacterized protein n=1 Tax=Melampsora larici-populina (strain 98AG31 / pathotype 3-4-7) TaxID=747676 RepID=F4SA87_MELLP|nr:uncharacterized protein MELLADRAFT_113541 [Melampsora larici-populina 98AG31]EGF98447.1 hypothetical protein MELLADRAFT_113541 [Melampsora larici-populina 98AG31]
MYLFQRNIQELVLSPSRAMADQDAFAAACFSHFYRPSASPSPILTQNPPARGTTLQIDSSNLNSVNTISEGQQQKNHLKKIASKFERKSITAKMVAESLKLFVRRTRHVGRAKMNNILQALRTNDKENSGQEQDRRLPIIRANSSMKAQKYESGIPEGFASPSSRSSTPCSSSPSSSADLDTEVIHTIDTDTELPSETVTKHAPKSHVSAKMYTDQLNDENISGEELISQLRSHQIQWAAMIELEKMDPSGILRGMSARQIRRLIQQKRSEAWLTETDGPLYESTEEHFSEDMMSQSSEESCTRYYPALEPTEDEDWSQYF